MQEFIYYNKYEIDFPLNENIFISNSVEEINSKNFLISNSKDVKAEFYASEIDFYIRNSKDDYGQKIKNVSKLYELNANKFDLAQDFPYKQKVSNSLMIIYEDSNDYENFTKLLNKDDFEVYKVEEKLIQKVDGTIGEFKITVKSSDKEIVLETSQIVWFNQKLTKIKSGIYDPNIVGLENSLNSIKSNLNGFDFKKTLLYNDTICQFHERKDEVCARCEEVCPTNAITKIVKDRHLVFSNVDCTSCGECISICPSGSLDYAELNRDSLYELSLFYKNTHPLILSSSLEIDSINVGLKDGVLPFYVNGDIFDESTLLTFLQISGSQLIYFSKAISKATLESIRILNDIYQAKYNKDAIFFVQNDEELENAMKELSFVENSYYNFNQKEMKKREVFSKRLEFLVENEDLGVVKTGPHIHYGRVEVNEANCTLCLSCVGACNVDALFANEADFTLRVNPSICTACGYCEIVCPETDCLTINYDEIELKPNWFKESILATDKLFACIECGKEFATTKAIEKIAKLMAPIFAKHSAAKEKTLYCCDACKPKVMIQEGLLDA